MARVILILMTLFAAAEAQAMDGFSVATGLMVLTNSTSQGGQGSQGSTILTQTDFTYHSGWWAAGLYAQYDRQGDSQTDTAAGPRLELAFDPFYLEAAYAAMMNRSFIDRAIAEQKGSGYTLGLGARFPIGTSKSFFMQFSYKYRVQTIATQDGKDLDEKVTQIDGYPLGGIGIAF